MSIKDMAGTMGTPAGIESRRKLLLIKTTTERGRRVNLPARTLGIWHPRYRTYLYLSHRIRASESNRRVQGYVEIFLLAECSIVEENTLRIRAMQSSHLPGLSHLL